MPPQALLDLLDKSLRSLQNPQPHDAVLECPASTRHLLSTHPAALIKLAHSKIHSYQFNQVPVCWRRLFTDASICKAICIIRENLKADGEHEDNEESKAKTGDGSDQRETCIQEVVRLMDMALIMAGAPGRAGMIEEILSAFQDWVEEGEQSAPPRKRRRRDEDSFPRIGNKIPTLNYRIPRLSAPSMAEFEEHLPTASPLVITDALEHWPALEARPWKCPSYLLKRTFGGRRLIPVEIGRSYTDEGWGQSIMTFKEFMERYMLTLDPLAKEPDKGDIAYLAQHDLFAQVPSLRNDISIPDYCYTDPPRPAPGTPLSLKPPQEKLEEPLLNAWFGPAGTVSPLHTDPYHNILCQVVGRKYVRLYSPTETEKLYPRDNGASGVDMSNTSQVDVGGEALDLEVRFPLFEQAEYVEAVLEEGESLYMPVGWWHYIRSLEASFSVSFWWN